MATTYTGQSGVIKMDTAAGTATALAEVTAFSIDHTVNTIESSAMGDQYRQYRTSINEWSGSADIYLSSDEISNFGDSVLVGNGAGAGSNGATITLEAYPGGDTAGFPKLSGEVIVTGFSVSSEMEGMVTASISFQGTGALTLGTAS
jgi:hypothetical protein